MLALSLVANAALIVALFVVLARARQRIVAEKCATFAGCVGAMTSGLAIDDVERRFKTIGFYLASLRAGSDGDKEDMHLYLTRASMLRVFRQVTLADVGEHLRLLGLQAVNDDDEPGSEMLEYISTAKAGDKEPGELWGDKLVAANLVAEKKLLGIYCKQITSAPIRIFE